MATIAEQLTKLNDSKQAIKGAIEAKGVTVGDAPLSEYAGKIAAIEGGGGGGTQFGVDVHLWLGDLDEAGTLSANTTPRTVDFTGVKVIGASACVEAFYNKSGRTIGILVPDLTRIEQSGMDGMFKNATSFEGAAEFPKLAYVNTNGLNYTFSYSRATSFSAPNLSEIAASGMQYCCFGCSRLTSVNLDGLMKVGSQGLTGAFASTKITTISFPSLYSVEKSSFGTASYNYIFYSSPSLLEIHFAKAAQPQIEAMTGYADKWGATNATIYFDL